MKTDKPDLGPYIPIAKLGGGGAAQVFLAVRSGPSAVRKLVVVKCMRAEQLDDPTLVGMFHDEARVSLQLNHPNLIHTYEFFEHEDVPYLVMEFVEGQPLHRVLGTRGKVALSSAAKVRILVDVLDALHYAHGLVGIEGKELAIVHRDVSPQNIIVTYAGVVKLVDFGIAKSSDMRQVTQMGIFKGKARYASPEQAMGAKVDPRTDIFSVGVLLWEAIVGARLWDDETELKVLMRLSRGQIPSARDPKLGIDPAMVAILERALAPRPDDRYATAGEMSRALCAYLAESPGGSPRLTDIGDTVAAAFADERRNLRASLELQLAALNEQASRSTLPTLALRAVVDAHGSVGGVSEGLEGTASTPAAARTVSTRAVPSAPVVRRRWARAVVATAAVAVVLLGMRRSLRSSETSSRVSPSLAGSIAPAALPPAAASTLDAAAPRERRVELSATPATAKLYLDDVELPTNPFVDRRALDDAEHVFRARATNYHSEQRALHFNDDVKEVITLRPAAPPPPPPRRASGVPAASPTAMPMPAPSLARPTPPPANHHTIDEQDPYLGAAK